MEAKELRIVFMGTPEFAATSLRQLCVLGYNVVGVVTTPDRPAGRGQKMHESDVKLVAKEFGLPILQPEKLRDEEFLATLRSWEPDLGIVIAFRMLPEVVWAMPRLGTFNLHASLLPQYRGAAPINWAIMNGEEYTGVTTFMLNHEIDKGDILEQSSIRINPQDNAGTLHDRLMVLGEELVRYTIDKLASGDFACIDQGNFNDDELMPAPKIFKDDCRIDWSSCGCDIVNKVRGLSPYPAAWTPIFIGDAEVGSMKLFEVRFEAESKECGVGSVVTDLKSYYGVRCKDGVIYLESLQLAGKKRMSIKELLLGWRDAAQVSFVGK